MSDRETMGLMDVADDIFWMHDWRRHAPASGRSTGSSRADADGVTAPGVAPWDMSALRILSNLGLAAVLAAPAHTQPLAGTQSLRLQARGGTAHSAPGARRFHRLSID